MGPLLRLVVLAALLYIAYAVGAPRFRAWRFKDSMRQTARLAEATRPDALRRALLESADELGVPLSPYRLDVSTSPDGDVSIRARWQEIVTIDAWRLGEWVDTLRFDYEVREP